MENNTHYPSPTDANASLPRRQQRFGEVLAQFALFQGMGINDLAQVMDPPSLISENILLAKRLSRQAKCATNC